MAIFDTSVPSALNHTHLNMTSNNTRGRKVVNRKSYVNIVHKCSTTVTALYVTVLLHIMTFIEHWNPMSAQNTRSDLWISPISLVISINMLTTDHIGVPYVKLHFCISNIIIAIRHYAEGPKDIQLFVMWQRLSDCWSTERPYKGQASRQVSCVCGKMYAWRQSLARHQKWCISLKGMVTELNWSVQLVVTVLGLWISLNRSTFWL